MALQGLRKNPAAAFPLESIEPPDGGLNPMASRRAPPPKPERPRHTVQQKNADINALERRIKQLQDFDPTTIRKRFSAPKVQVLETAIDETLSDIFGNGSDDYERYSGAAHLDQGGLSMV